MSYRGMLASVLVASTVLTGAAYAAEQAAAPAAQQAAGQTAVDRDVGKLSKDGAQAFRDMHLARIAIFDADPAQAKALVGKAQAALAKSKTDEAVYRKAESGLMTSEALSAHGKPAAKAPDTTATAPDAKAATSEAVSWLPVDAQLTLGEDFTATPAKAAAVADANTSLAKGDKSGALEKLKLAHVDVSFVMAVLPLDRTTADVDQAATLIGQGKYYEANAQLKQAEDGMRFDVIDAVGLPGKTAPQATAPQATAAPQTKTTK